MGMEGEMGKKGEGKEGGERDRGRGGREGRREEAGRENIQIEFSFSPALIFFYDALNIKIVNVPPGLSSLDSRCTLVQALFVKAWCLQEDDQRWTNIPSDCFASHGLCHQVPW